MRFLSDHTQNTDFLLYSSDNGDVKINVTLSENTIWLSQEQIADLFAVNRPAISKHLKNIFDSGELQEDSVRSILETTASDGKNYKVKYYNLDAIISVGYRVNSGQATKFRIWATDLLRDYLIKGFVLDDNRMKNGSHLFEQDYFDELLERVRSIRASERRIYQKITDIFAECSIDYDANSQITKNFYAHIQDKFHFAITGKTAAEIIFDSADHTKPKMGLTSFKNAPKGRVLKSDVIIAKNYLSESDIKRLERTISSFFDYIENIIENRQNFTMDSFSASVHKFLEFNEFKILTHFGKRLRSQAEHKAHSEYDIFNKTQKIDSDFDKIIKQTLDKK
jgi:hypothetical protein